MNTSSVQPAVDVKPSRRRIWELDAWRGVVIVYMLLFHFLFDLHFLYGYPVNPHQLLLIGPIKPGHIVSLTFYPVAGICSGLSRNAFKNGAKLSLVALAFSLVTWLFFPEEFIRFGTLHLLSSAMLLTPLWRRFPTRALPFAAAVCYAIGVWTSGQVVSSPWLFPLGLLSPGFTSLDYFPLFPYLAPYIIGVWLQRVIYTPRGNSSLLAEWRWTRPLQFLGRSSLSIYVLHQPLYMAVLFLLLGPPH